MCGMFIVSVTSRLGCLSVPGEAHSPLKRMGHRLRLIAGRFRQLGNSLSFYLPVERSRIRLHFELCPSRSRRSVAELQRGWAPSKLFARSITTIIVYYVGMAEAATLVVCLNEDDIPGASLPEPLEKQSVPALKRWLLCRGIEMPRNTRKKQLLNR